MHSWYLLVGFVFLLAIVSVVSNRDFVKMSQLLITYAECETVPR